MGEEKSSPRMSRISLQSSNPNPGAPGLESLNMKKDQLLGVVHFEARFEGCRP